MGRCRTKVTAGVDDLVSNMMGHQKELGNHCLEEDKA
jgi:hypothetical protein